MIPRALLLPLLAVGLLSLSACKDKEPDPQTIPVSSAAPPTAPVAADQAPTGAPAAPAGSEAAVAPPPATDTPATPQPTGQKGGGASIDACCAGLLAINASGRSPESKAKAGTAHKLCLGLAKRVKDGEVSKAQAIGTIRATLGDVTAPGECK